VAALKAVAVADQVVAVADQVPAALKAAALKVAMAADH
jgi:hypothetical protein